MHGELMGSVVVPRYKMPMAMAIVHVHVDTRSSHHGDDPIWVRSICTGVSPHTRVRSSTIGYYDGAGKLVHVVHAALLRIPGHTVVQASGMIHLRYIVAPRARWGHTFSGLHPERVRGS